MLVDNQIHAADSILETMEPYVGTRYMVPEVEQGWTYRIKYGVLGQCADYISFSDLARDVDIELTVQEAAKQLGRTAAIEIEKLCTELFGKGE